MYAIYIYGNIYHQYTPVMLAYIPAPWIRHGSYNWSKSKVKMNPTLQVHQKRLHQRGILVSSGVKKHPTKFSPVVAIHLRISTQHVYKWYLGCLTYLDIDCPSLNICFWIVGWWMVKQIYIIVPGSHLKETRWYFMSFRCWWFRLPTHDRLISSWHGSECLGEELREMNLCVALLFSRCCSWQIYRSCQIYPIYWFNYWLYKYLLTYWSHVFLPEVATGTYVAWQSNLAAQIAAEKPRSKVSGEGTMTTQTPMPMEDLSDHGGQVPWGVAGTIYINMYIYIYTHTYTYIYIHT